MLLFFFFILLIIKKNTCWKVDSASIYSIATQNPQNKYLQMLISAVVNVRMFKCFTPPRAVRSGDRDGVGFGSGWLACELESGPAWAGPAVPRGVRRDSHRSGAECDPALLPELRPPHSAPPRHRVPDHRHCAALLRPPEGDVCPRLHTRRYFTCLKLTSCLC